MLLPAPPTPLSGGTYITPSPCEVEALVLLATPPYKVEETKFLRKIIEFLLNIAPQHWRFLPRNDVEEVVLLAPLPHKVEANLIICFYRLLLSIR